MKPYNSKLFILDKNTWYCRVELDRPIKLMGASID